MARPSNIPNDWKQFKLANGEQKWLPPWAKEPLNFTISPDNALRRGAFSKIPNSIKKRFSSTLKSK
jgi:hypothetical protein